MDGPAFLNIDPAQTIRSRVVPLIAFFIMKTPFFIQMALLLLPASAGLAENAPVRVSLSLKNDLTELKIKAPGGGFGCVVCGDEITKGYQDGFRIGAWNDHYKKRDILVIDDGKTRLPTTDKETGLPILILIDAKITDDLRHMVDGYNSAMRSGIRERKQPAARKGL